jgi:hypothetical protein
MVGDDPHPGEPIGGQGHELLERPDDHHRVRSVNVDLVERRAEVRRPWTELPLGGDHLAFELVQTVRIGRNAQHRHGATHA